MRAARLGGVRGPSPTGRVAAQLAICAAALGACGGDERLTPVDDGGGSSPATTSSAATGATTSSTSTSTAQGTGGAGTGGTGGAGGQYEGACTPLELGDTWVFFESVARTGVQARVSPPIGELARTRLTLELYEDDGSGALGPVEPGVFPLGVAPDDSYATCQHCVLLVGYDVGGQPQRAFFAKNGTMRVDDLDDDDWTILVGSVEAAELVEVTQDPDLSWHEVPGGDCYYVDRWAFDTVPVDGGPCESAEQCPNVVQQVCDPGTGTCGPPQCSLTFDPPFCGDGEICLSQLSDPDETVSGPAIGACYRTCDPAAGTGCGADETCRPLGPTQDLGVCYRLGEAELGESCTPRDISTECAPGSVCTGEVGVCAAICPFLTEEAGCQEGTACTLADLCEPIDAGDGAAVGDVCDPASPELRECGLEGDAFRGLCLKFFLEDPDLVCERLCRTDDPACPGDEVCLGVFSNTAVGICHPRAICGDDVVDVIGGELCDDGNTDDGDGCSGDCSAAELAFLCDDALPLALDVDVAGDTRGGPTGYPSFCDPYVATEVATYAFTPTAPGELRLDVSSEGSADLGLSVLGDCADGATELACAARFGDDVVFVEVTTPASPLMVVVRGASPGQAGPFTLRGSYREAACGDGEPDGAEACDDGNTDDGDGCSGDCTSLDWTAVCAGLPELPVGTTIEATTVGGSTFFDLGGICSTDVGQSRERAWSFTAPSAGTLHLVLTQPTANFSLYVEDGCGPPSWDTFLACSNFAWPGTNEESFVDLAAGQTVTVIVDGFGQTEEGELTLGVDFSP